MGSFDLPQIRQFRFPPTERAAACGERPADLTLAACGRNLFWPAGRPASSRCTTRKRT